MENKKRYSKRPREEREFEQSVIDLARVTRVMKGGKRMRFRACLAIGDKKGRCGVGIAKAADVTAAINKAVDRAKKNMVTVPIVNETIPHRMYFKEGAVKILLKPAPKGTGVKAGGAVRVVLELAGIPNITSKILGTNNKINNVQGLIHALGSFKTVPASRLRKAKTEKKPETAEKKAPAKKEEPKKTTAPKKTEKKKDTK